jgi:hypothetical protein
VKGIEKALKEHGVYIGKTTGDSMLPMLRQGRDTVVIEKAEFPLKKYDVPLYRRNDHYTLHRIIKKTKKGYIICGDNRANLERDITDKDIIGVLTGFYRDGVYIGVNDKAYLKYSKRVCRRAYLRIAKKYLRAILRKLKIIKK